jgi:hypothetical protein
MAIDIRLYFDCASKKTYVKDFTDYNTSEFPDRVQIEGNGTLFDPTNNMVFNLVDFAIDKDINPNVTNEYSLNVTTSNTIIPGNYNFNYSNTYNFNNGGDDLNMSFLNPSTISIPFTNVGLIWAAGDTFAITEATDEDNVGTYTISEISYNNDLNICYITVTTNTFVATEGPDINAEIEFSPKQIPVYIDKTYTYTSCASVTPCITANYDCTSTPFGNITFEDSSKYPTGVVADDKEFTIYYPNGLDFTQSPNPDNYPIVNPLVVDTGSFVSISTLATGTWSAKLALTTSQTQVDGLVVVNSSSVVKEFNVSCTSNMCGLSSCLTKLKDRHISYLKSSTVSPLQQYVDNVQLLYTMAREAQACGDKNGYERYIAEIFAVVKQTDTSCGCGCSGSCSGSCDCGCDDGCGCGETGPTWVNNVGININSLLEELAGIPDQVDALQTTVDGLSEDVSALNDWTGLGETLPGGQNLFNAVDSLINTTTNLGGQVNNNTGDISGLQIQVDTLDAEVAALQEQIADFSPSDSEISTYELMTNDSSKKCVWQASLGTANSSTEYSIVISGDVTTFLNTSQISFYNPTTQAWFYGVVSNASYSGGSNSTTLTVQFSSSTYSNGCSWQDSSVSFPVYKGNLSTSNYNLTTSLLLDNDNYWKYADDTHKYWSKIKASFIINEPSANATGLIDPFIIKNVTANKSITLRDLPCGSFIDLELSFEKQYDGTAYDCVIVIDVKYNTTTNTALSETSELLFGGYSGFNPKYGYGIDLRFSAGTLELDISSNESVSSTQDVYNSANGSQNTNRIISRQASGPNYTGNPTFFSGDELESILFNETNINITLLNIEQSYGKMPVA